MRISLFFMLICFGVAGAFAQCDPTRFKSTCEIPFSSTAKKSMSLVYCGEHLGYITKTQYEILRRYQRADINMVLLRGREYMDSPCIPAGK